ncbi:hypothetical protein V1477_010207 [Vespula maculifrons]|uniref:Uncharacterized protein n=1 Tax=Vespula maculifrons TaxID=7453 RepID=A0ABD2C7V9_VESMC
MINGDEYMAVGILTYRDCQVRIAGTGPSGLGREWSVSGVDSDAVGDLNQRIAPLGLGLVTNEKRMKKGRRGGGPRDRVSGGEHLWGSKTSVAVYEDTVSLSPASSPTTTTTTTTLLALRLRFHVNVLGRGNRVLESVPTTTIRHSETR